VTIPGMNPTDVEDMALGPCGSGQCLYFGDIGDNNEDRKSVELWVIEEQETFGRYAKVYSHLKLHYPDRAHNAESLAVDPSTGDIWILTKEANYKKEVAYPAQLFRVPHELLSQSSGKGVLEFVGEIDLPFLNSDLECFGQIATAMDISPDGSRLLILTYQN